MATLQVTLFTAWSAQTVGAADVSLCPITPKPVSYRAGVGHFELNSKTVIHATEPKAVACARHFSKFLKQATGFDLVVQTSPAAPPTNNHISFSLSGDKDLKPEGYQINIQKNLIHIVAKDAAGLFYGSQSLRHLLPPEIESTKVIKDRMWQIPTARIIDSPRFSWRGIMLDEARHFLGKAYVLELLDNMAMCKMNRLHWHLTDQEGWVIEIKKHPKLTAERAPGTFYTQDQIREIVAYAEARHITIIPEIDMPGHSGAITRAYPEFSGGGNKRLPGFTLNPANEDVYTFTNDVFTELAGLFPGQWIHTGGDEVHFIKLNWLSLPGVKELMSKHAYKDTHDLENHFHRRVASQVKALGKKGVSWGNMLAAKVPTEDVVQIWWMDGKNKLRHDFVKSGYDVILCPHIPCYISTAQHESHRILRRWKTLCSTPNIYDYPKSLDGFNQKDWSKVLGIQLALWTEKVTNKKRADFLIYPRLFALAETTWTPVEGKDYADFEKRLKPMLQRLDLKGTGYFNLFDPKSTPEPPIK